MIICTIDVIILYIKKLIINYLIITSKYFYTCVFFIEKNAWLVWAVFIIIII